MIDLALVDSWPSRPVCVTTLKHPSASRWVKQSVILPVSLLWLVGVGRKRLLVSGEERARKKTTIFGFKENNEQLVKMRKTSGSSIMETSKNNGLSWDCGFFTLFCCNS